MTMILALALALASSPVCTQLAKDFGENEEVMASMHDFYQKRAYENRKYPTAGSALAARLEYWEDTNNIQSSDKVYLEKGDRITTLLIANKCKAPDHVTSWYTYSETNPARRSPSVVAPVKSSGNSGAPIGPSVTAAKQP